MLKPTLYTIAIRWNPSDLWEPVATFGNFDLAVQFAREYAIRYQSINHVGMFSTENMWYDIIRREWGL